MGSSRRSRQAGITILEILVGLAILGFSLAIAVAMNHRQGLLQQGRDSGFDQVSAQSLFAQYFMTHRAAIMSAIAAPDASNADVRRHCVMRLTNTAVPPNPPSNGQVAWSGGAGLSGLKTCAFDLTLLQQQGMLPAGMQVDRMSESGAWRYVAIVRRFRAPGPDGILNNADDVLSNDAGMLVVRMDLDGSLPAHTVAQWATLRPALQGAKAALGQTAGVLPVGNFGGCRGENVTAQICGQGWTFNINEWIDTAQANVIRSSLPPP